MNIVRYMIIPLVAAHSLSAQAVEFQAGDFTVGIGGYARADFIYDSDQDLGSTNFAGGLTTDGGNEGTHFRAHARQSRLGFTADNGRAKLKLEGDFFGAGGNETVSNSYGFRLRHANIQYGNWTAGQTWSTFMDRDFIAYPTTVDFDGSTGAVFARQTVLRYSVGNIDFAIENPETTAIADPGLNQPLVSETLPDLVVRYTATGDKVSWYGAGVAQTFEAQSGTADGESETLLGVHLGIAVKLEQANLSAAIVNNGGRYAYNAFNQPSVVAINGSLEAVDSTGIVLAASMPFAKGTFGIALGTVIFEDDYANELGLDTPEQLDSAHVNYRFKSSDDVAHGFEVSYVEREDFNGDTGDNTRFQYSATLSF